MGDGGLLHRLAQVLPHTASVGNLKSAGAPSRGSGSAINAARTAVDDSTTPVMASSEEAIRPASTIAKPVTICANGQVRRAYRSAGPLGSPGHYQRQRSKAEKSLFTVRGQPTPHSGLPSGPPCLKSGAEAELLAILFEASSEPGRRAACGAPALLPRSADAAPPGSGPSRLGIVYSGVDMRARRSGCWRNALSTLHRSHTQPVGRSSKPARYARAVRSVAIVSTSARAPAVCPSLLTSSSTSVSSASVDPVWAAAAVISASGSPKGSQPRFQEGGGWPGERGTDPPANH